VIAGLLALTVIAASAAALALHDAANAARAARRCMCPGSGLADPAVSARGLRRRPGPLSDAGRDGSDGSPAVRRAGDICAEHTAWVPDGAVRASWSRRLAVGPGYRPGGQRAR
jgi:hypothetical protein